MQEINPIKLEIPHIDVYKRQADAVVEANQGAADADEVYEEVAEEAEVVEE